MASEAVTPSDTRGADPKGAIEALELQLRNTPRATRPYEHAAVAYRLGLALAESPLGSRTEMLRKALACFDVAAAIFDPRLDPVEHARVLNAAGASQRALGDRRKAVGLFEKAAELLDARERDDERAAALNNLGLARAELGEIDGAVDAFDAAVDLFDAGSPEGRRGRVATLHNRGQARAATGSVEGLEAALADYDEATSHLDPDEAPYHYGLVNHSMGVAFHALANQRAEERERLLEEAVSAFTESLTVFSRTGFPYQHALAKHNLGLARASLARVRGEAAGDGAKADADDEEAADAAVADLRRALAHFEDAVALLDTRLHADAWKQAYNSLARVEEELAPTFPGMTRAGHFAALLAGCSETERKALLRERLLRFLALPEPRRRSALVELGLAAVEQGWEGARAIMEAELLILVELPTESLEVGLTARYAAHQRLEGEARETADRALDQAIGDALGAPQRIFVRDFLYGLGWERP